VATFVWNTQVRKILKQEQEQEIGRLSEQVEVLKSIIDDARVACALVVDKTAQQDLLNP